MEVRSLQFLAEACGGEIIAGSPAHLVPGLTTDSRRLTPGAAFVALRGDRFDGHDFLRQAIAGGAAALIVEHSRRSEVPGRMPAIAVESTRSAYGRMAARYRADFNPLVVAVCGSNGKTTTKELAAAVFRHKFPLVASEASFNNDIGVPNTLLKVDSQTRAAILEAGTNHPGELRPLLDMIQPRYGILTSIGREHLEFFGDLDGVVREEGTLAEVLPCSGALFLDGDDKWSAAVAQRATTQVVRVGFGASNDWRIVRSRMDSQGSTFVVEGPLAEINGDYRVNLLGRHQVLNSLFVIAVAATCGLTRAEISAGLRDCKGAKMRMQSWEAGGVRVLDDAYNANADSMTAALCTLRDLPCKGRRVAVLGDMGELGAYSEQAHQEVGRRAAELGIGQLFAVGKMATVMGRAAREAGLHRVFEFPDIESASAAVKSFLKPGDLLLLKASRAMAMERMANLLRGG